MSRLIFAASIVLLIAVGLVWDLEERALKPLALTPALTGAVEYCLTCHADLPEISPSHPVKTFGCVICHGGERLALDADLAHSSMRGGANPSDLAVVEPSCGGEACHSGGATEMRDHTQRVITSIQTTYTGAISSLRYTFGAQADPIPRFGTAAVTDFTLPSQTGILSLEAFTPDLEAHPSLKTFGENCLSCHLNAQAANGSQTERFTGCAACHTPMLDLAGERRKPGTRHILSTSLPYQQCNTCHNRGNYDLRLMTFIERSDQAVTRLENYYQPIAQFTRCEYTLDCIDCHTRTEAMGDGDLHATMADIQYIQCKTCHGTLDELPLTRTLFDPNEIAFRQALLNPIIDLQIGDTVLVTEQGETLWNTRLLPDGSYELIGKVTRQQFVFHPVQGSGCEQDPAQQASEFCHECHAVER